MTKFFSVDTKSEEMSKVHPSNAGTGKAKNSGQKSHSSPQPPNKFKSPGNVQAQTKKLTDTQHNPSGSQSKPHSKQRTKDKAEAPQEKASKIPIIKTVRNIARNTELTKPDTKKFLDEIYQPPKYVRLDDSLDNEETLYTLLTQHWKLPELVISIYGGNESCNNDVLKLLTAADNEEHIKDTWIVTDGKCIDGSDPTMIQPVKMLKQVGQVVTNSERNLEENHTHFLLCDSKTEKSLHLRGKLEEHIIKNTHPENKEFHTLMVMLVLGGDKSIIDKAAWAVENEIGVMIVEGSGNIANMLASLVKKLNRYGTTAEAVDKVLHEFIEQQENKEKGMEGEETGYCPTQEKKENLKKFLMKRSVVILLDRNCKDFTKEAISLSHKIELIRTLSDKDGELIQEQGKNNIDGVLSDSFHKAIDLKKLEFWSKHCEHLLKSVEECDLRSWLHGIYKKVMSEDGAASKVVHNLTGITGHTNFIKGYEESARPVLPYVGKVIYKLLGNNYRILYQEEIFHDENLAENKDSHSQTYSSKNLAKNEDSHSQTSSSTEGRDNSQLTLANHLLFWAVLTNQKDIAEILWRYGKNNIAMALIVYKMFMKLSKAAESLREVTLQKEMEKNAQYFENLAEKVIGAMYEKDRIQAWRCLGAKVAFNLGRSLTPLSIAYDSGAKEFLGHSCCQSLLRLIWMNGMDLNTQPYQLFPLLSPINPIFITFTQDVLKYSLMPSQKANDPPKQNAKSTSTNGNRKQNAENTSTNDPQKQNAKNTSNYVHGVGKRMFQWFRLERYFTAPINKFVHGFISFLIFLGIFTYFVLSELKPLDPNKVGEVKVAEWLVYSWMLSYLFQEIKEVSHMYRKKISGPLFNKTPIRTKVWRWHEKLKFTLGFHWLEIIFSDYWNLMDFFMIILFVVTAVVRFILKKNDFAVVRILFCILILLSYFRILRFGYVLKQLGPRIAVIWTLLKDLASFMFIMMVFIVSFGVAFQSLINPNEEPSWQLLRDVLWRGYWQMLGEIFVDDATEEQWGMGLETERNCTTDRELVRLQPDMYEHCQEWFLPVLLGVFMMITNILLLNLLIAIFSNSFQKAEEESHKIWHYHLYDLYYEYHSQAWVILPFNGPWYLCKSLYNLSKKEKSRPQSGPEFAENLFCLDGEFRNDGMEEDAVKQVSRS